MTTRYLPIHLNRNGTKLNPQPFAYFENDYASLEDAESAAGFDTIAVIKINLHTGIVEQIHNALQIDEIVTRRKNAEMVA